MPILLVLHGNTLSIDPTVDMLTPKRWLRVRYSTLVASLHTVVATRCCTLLAFLNVVSLRRMYSSNSPQSNMNVGLAILRFDSNIVSGQASMSIASLAFLAHQSFQGKVHTDRSGEHVNSALSIAQKVIRLLCLCLCLRTRFACRFICMSFHLHVVSFACRFICMLFH